VYEHGVVCLLLRILMVDEERMRLIGDFNGWISMFFFNALTLLAELSSRNAIWSDINEILLFPKFV